MKKSKFAWIVSVFFLLSAFAFFPSFSSILMMLAGVLMLPISFIQSKLAFYLKKPLKVVAIIALVLLAMVFLPANEESVVENDVPITTVGQTEEAKVEAEDTTEQVVEEPSKVTEPTESVVEYHKDKDINALLNNYNENAECPIDVEMILSSDHDSANIACNNASVKITCNSLGMFVDLIDEAEDDSAIYPLFVGFMKAMNVEMTTEEIDAVWNELRTGTYGHYAGKYSIHGIDISYDTVELNGGKTKYTIMIEARN